MDDVQGEEGLKETSGVLSPEEKHAEFRERIERTVIACFMGILAGIASYILSGDKTATGTQPNAIIGWLILLAFVVIQKYVFLFVKIDFTKLTAKDWLYQAFMTFSLWFISWTILLSADM